MVWFCNVKEKQLIAKVTTMGASQVSEYDKCLSSTYMLQQSHLKTQIYFNIYLLICVMNITTPPNIHIQVLLKIMKGFVSCSVKEAL